MKLCALNYYFFFNRSKQQRSEPEEFESDSSISSYEDSDSSLSESLKAKYKKGLILLCYTIVLYYAQPDESGYADLPNLLYILLSITISWYFLGYVANEKRRGDKSKESSEKVDAETYGLASSSKNTAKIPKTGRKKSGKVRVRFDSKDEPAVERKKSRQQARTEDEEQKKSRRQAVLLDSEDEPAVERKKSRRKSRRQPVLLDSEDEPATERKKSEPKRYNNLNDMDTDLKEALRVGEILTIFVVYFL
jgi:hypothetical protein